MPALTRSADHSVILSLSKDQPPDDTGGIVGRVSHLKTWALYAALGLAFFGSLILAAQFFPRPYDWRLDVMSLLAEPQFNPRAYAIACAGLALSGLLLLFFPRLLQRRLSPAAPRTSAVSGFCLYLAAIFLTLSGILPGHVAGLGRTHETFAHAYGVAISLAMLGYFAATLRLPTRYKLQRFAGLPLIVIPFGGFMVSRLSLLLPAVWFSSAGYDALRYSLWNRLALWEWIAAIGTYLFLGLLLTLPEKEPPSS
jgi:hypothetical protein